MYLIKALAHRGVSQTMADRGFGRSDEANFINFCSGAELTNGRQIATGSCNGIPMVKIPAVTNMISAMIVHP